MNILLSVLERIISVLYSFTVTWVHRVTRPPQNDARLSEAKDHVEELERQAGEFGSILTGAKGPAARSLEAAQAYGNIAEAMREAEQRAEEARNDAEESVACTRNMVHKGHPRWFYTDRVHTAIFLFAVDINL